MLKARWKAGMVERSSGVGEENGMRRRVGWVRTMEVVGESLPLPSTGEAVLRHPFCGDTPQRPCLKESFVLRRKYRERLVAFYVCLR